MNNICLLFGLFPEEKKAEIINNHKGVIQYAANALQWAFVSGLADLCHTVTIINLPYLSGFPLGYKRLYNEGYCFGNDVIRGYNVRYCNFSVYNMFSRYYNAKKTLLEWVQEDDKNRTIIIYAMSSPFISAAAAIKRKYPDVKIVSIVPDLPEYMSDNKSLIYQFYKWLNFKILAKQINHIDYYVLLSKYMVEKLPIGHKPWIVIEGIYNAPSDKMPSKTIQGLTKVILYTGTLAKRYGIMMLLEAFSQTKDINYRLVICGAGEAQQDIIDAINKDSRISFLGQKPREEILVLQRCATLLVNPRSNEGDYTKYSFPSKTIEYFASGTPSLICKLPGIPDEYYKYCYSLKDMSVESLRDAINEILSKNNDELITMGKNAREFIISRKNATVQCGKLINMLKQ